MVYLVAATGGLLFLSLITLFALLIRKDRCASFDDVREMAYSFRSPYRGICRPAHPGRRLARTARRLAKDRKEGRKLFEFEKWFYDNYYLVRQSVAAVSRMRWRGLPYSGGVPRVLTLAKFAVDHIEPTREAITDLLAAVQQVTPFTWQELSALPIALRWAHLNKLADMVKRSDHCRAMAKLAKGPTLHDLMEDDCYLYYHYPSEAPSAYQPRVDQARRQFFLTLVEWEQRTRRCIEGMRFASANLPYEYLLTLSTSLPLLDQQLKDVSNETKLGYLAGISRIAERCNLQESVIVRAVNHIARLTGEDVARVVEHPTKIKRFVRRGKVPKFGGTVCRQRVFIACCIVASALLAALPSVFDPTALTILGSVLLLLALIPSVEQVFKSLYRRRMRGYCMGYREVPDTAKTLVVVSRYVDTVGSFEEANKDLIALSYNSPPANLTYCMLIDLPSSKVEWGEGDEKVLEAIRQAAAVNPNLLYALRRRVKQGEKYVAWERKRGAILNLFGAILGQESPFAYISRPFEDYKLALLLDDDSRLLPGGVLDAVNCALHPANRRYQILTFDTSVNKYSLTTRYSRRFAEDGNVGYPTGGDFYDAAFGTSLYQGKAIVRIQPFYQALRHAFPEGRVLSHDLIEGAMLKTGSLHRTLYEDAPSSFMADTARTTRWQRGDVLLLPYLGRKVAGNSGIKYNPHIQPIYKWVMALNVIGVVKDLCLLLTVFLGCLGNYWLVVAAFGAVMLPYLVHASCAFFATRNALKYRLLDTLKVCWDYVRQIALIPFRALNGFKILVGTLWRSAKGSNALVWQPFYLTQKAKGLGRFILATLPAALFAVVLTIIAFDPVMLALAMLYILYVFMLADNRPLRIPKVSEGYTRQLKQFALDTLNYFRSYDGLIPDNLQLDPKPTGKDMTSPTDLGFALLAEVCALELQQDPNIVWERIAAMADRLVVLPTWQGHLYNWYSTDGRPLNGIVSTVDSANFVVAALVTIAACREGGRPDLADRLEGLTRADFSRLYDWQRNMLVISYDADTDKPSGVYDTLMSESRLAYLLAIAQGIPVQAYLGLARDLGRGNVTLSWGGTAFEYLMPALFVRAPYHSLLRQAESKGARLQAKAKIDGLWGRSESCYYALGADLRYQYQSNGVEGLALSPEVGREVVSPYSSALALPCLPDEAAQNLLSLSMVASDKYGFFEGIERGHPIPVHMAHHQGMLLCAITNALSDDVLCRYFASVPPIASALMLMGEGPAKGRVRHLAHRYAMPETSSRSYVYTSDHLAAHVLHSKGSKGVFLSDGRGEVHIGEIMLGVPNLGLWQQPDVRILVQDPTDLSVFGVYDPGDDCRFRVSADEVRYINPARHLTDNVRLLPAGDGVLHDVTIDNTSGVDNTYRLVLHSSLALASKGAMLSHRCYQDLFVVTDEVEGGLCAYRQTTEGKRNQVVVGTVGLTDVKIDTNRLNLYEKGGLVKAFVSGSIGQGSHPHFGSVLYPAVTIEGVVQVKAGETAHVYWYATRSQDPEETVKTWQTHFDSKIYHYLAMAAEEPFADLYNKYATHSLGYTLAAALLNRLPADQAVGAQGSERSIPLSDNWEEDLSRALAVRLLEGIGDYRLSTPSVVDYKGRTLMDVAAKVGDYPKCDLTPRSRDYRPRFSPVRRPVIPLDCEVGEGGFVGNDYVVSCHPLLPYSNVVSTGSAGFVLSHRGGGWLFGDNSREVKYTSWRADPIGDEPCHRLWAWYQDRVYPLLGEGCLAIHSTDSTRYKSILDGNVVEVCYSVAGEQIIVDIVAQAPIKVFFAVDIPLAWTSDDRVYLKRASSRQAVVCSGNKRAALYAPHGQVVTNDNMLRSILGGEDIADKRFDYLGWLTEPTTHATFGLGGKGDAPHRLPIPLGCSDSSLNRLLNGLWRQVVHSRLLGRAGPYQCGGAFGYRDQLQDLTVYMYGGLDQMRDYLVNFASHQYLEGDVQHWWHPPRTGVRTRITDDRLFLVTTLARYIEWSGDVELLQKEVPYLASDPLAKGETSRYETPSLTRPYPIAHHVYMALDSVLKYGRHGLLLVGGGDWNDGMDKVGIEGQGESVWLTMYAYRTIKDSLDLFGKEHRTRLIKELARLKKGINDAFVKDRFLAFFDDKGEAIGDGKGQMALYLLTQAWATLSGAVDPNKCAIALSTARNLVDYDQGLVKLFDPPFSPSDKVGYIAAYPEGVRENGGQYTHAVCWYLLALIEAGQSEYAYELFKMINPIDTPKGGGPYVLSADVYTHVGYAGWSGWSWYTGSAAWMIRVVVEGFYGLCVRNRNVYLDPRLPEALADSTLVWTFEGTTYRIRCLPSTQEDLLVDGRSVGKYFSLLPNRGEVEVERRYRRK